jgi:hypothetical protein
MPFRKRRRTNTSDAEGYDRPVVIEPIACG